MTALARKLEQWRGCDPVSMSCQSEAAITYAFRDMRHDILALAADRDALLKALVALRDAGNGWSEWHERFHPSIALCRAAIARCEP